MKGVKDKHNTNIFNKYILSHVNGIRCYQKTEKSPILTTVYRWCFLKMLKIRSLRCGN